MISGLKSVVHMQCLPTTTFHGFRLQICKRHSIHNNYCIRYPLINLKCVFVFIIKEVEAGPAAEKLMKKLFIEDQYNGDTIPVKNDTKALHVIVRIYLSQVVDLVSMPIQCIQNGHIKFVRSIMMPFGSIRSTKCVALDV